MFFRYLIIVFCALSTSISAAEEKKVYDHMKLTLTAVDGTGDDPMFVIWLENKKGFVKTLYWFSEDDEWYPDLTTWEKKRKKAGYKSWKDEPGIDAVIGPTIAWGGKKSCKIPIQQGKINLLDGSYRIRIEQCKDKGGHYTKFKLPLSKKFKGGELKDTNGYIANLKLELIKKKK